MAEERPPADSQVLALPLRAVKRYRDFLEEVPRIWKPNRDWNMRFWAIDEAGELRRLELEEINAPRRLAIDLLVAQAVAKCLRLRPVAIVMAAESWISSFKSDATAEQMRRDLGGTPNLSEPENRELLRQRYGAEISEGLIVQGELAGNESPDLIFYAIQDGKVGARRRKDVAKATSRFAGILNGSWTPNPPGDWR